MFQSLVWFRHDLRLADHAALWQAQQQGPCVALVIICPQQWQAHDDAPCKIHFYLRQLLCLKQQLAQYHIPLMVASLTAWQQIPTYLSQLCRQLNIDTVHANHELAYNEQQRDRAVQQHLAQHQQQLRLYHDRTLFVPGSIRNQNGAPYQVFSAFKTQCYQRLQQALPRCYPAPKPQPPIALPFTPPQANLEVLLEQYASTTAIEQLWPVGEHTAQRMLQQFLAEAIPTYARWRDFPAHAATSRLSPYLNCGLLSIRQCLQALFAGDASQLHFAHDGQQVWLDELLWREFYQHILFDFPKIAQHQSFKTERQQLQWRDAPADLAAWQHGQTGIPIVDAGMRELLHTGWMHNRVRMICAMFLSKNLLLDWRKGEQWFMQHLIDGDLAANNGGWQWSASTGTDAVPYFRIFNPIRQSQRFDPEGVYLKRWLPELAQLDAKQIHAPYAHTPHPTLDYPHPIVDLKFSRQRALAHFS
jgi:deoxyribodipyrimidine photo-lyase